MHDATALAVAEIRRLGALVAGADMTTPVRTCPGWTLADLIEHVGTVNRWATYMVEHLSAERASREDMDFDPPSDPNSLSAWLAAGAEPLGNVFGAADPEAEMWVWGLDKHVRFWPRRMVHETGVHRADAEIALGRAPVFEGAIAADGIDELLDNIACASYFAPRVDELRGEGDVIRLDATDTGDQWRIILQPDRYEWQRGGGVPRVRGAGTPGDDEVVVHGSASELLLALYGRGAPGAGVVVEGDAELFAFWLERSAL